MPDGEPLCDGVWSVIAARPGNVIGSINGGLSPHETIVDLSGKRVDLGVATGPILEVASTAMDRASSVSGRSSRGLGHSRSTGGKRSRRPPNWPARLPGEQHQNRPVLFTIGSGPRFPLHPATLPFSAPSHGISLTPNERSWGARRPNDDAHVFNVSQVPLRRPRRIADIRLAHPLTGDGWIQVSPVDASLCRGFGRRAQHEEL